MKVSCGQCQARYALDGDRARGRRVKIRCKRCGASIVVEGEARALELFVLIDGEQEGPHTVSECLAMAREGRIDGETLGWHAALDGWTPVAHIAGLEALGARSPFDAADDDDADESSPFTARAGGASARPIATGARAESSLLFSLANLESLASPRASTAATEGSGLIDIRALAAAVGPSRTSEAPTLDPMLSIGAPSPLLSPIAAPLVPAPTSRRAPLGLAAVALAVAIALVSGGAALLPHAEPAPAPIAAVVPARPAVTTPAPGVTTPAPRSGAVAAPEPRDEVAAIAPVVPDVERRIRPRPISPATQRVEIVEPVRHASSEAPSLEELLRRAGDPAAPGRESAAPGRESARPVSLAETPSRDEVRQAMSALEPAIRACADGAHGRALVSLAVSGDTGRVRSANVGGDFAGTEAGSCMARAARGASVAPFGRATFTIAYPYAL